MNISQAIYTRYHPVHQTKCPPICTAFRFSKLIVHQIYHVYGKLYADWIERQTDREGGRDRQRDPPETQRDTQRHADTHSNNERDTGRGTQKETERK